MALIAEHPTLHHPYGIRIARFDGTVYLITIIRQQTVTLFRTLRWKRDFHFVEAVHNVIIVLAELFLPFFDKHLPYTGKKRILRGEHPVMKSTAAP